MKRIVYLFTCFLFIGLISLSGEKVFAQGNEIETPEDYVKYLENFIVEIENQSTIQNDEVYSISADAQQVLRDFNELSYNDQQKFVDYITDPKVIKETLLAFDRIEKGETIFLYDGDIKIESKLSQPKTDRNYNNDFLSEIAPMNYYTRIENVHHDVDSYYLGIKVVTVRAYLQYKVEGNSSSYCCNVIEALNVSGAVIRNWVPVISIEDKPGKAYVQKGLAVGRVTWTFSFVHSKLGFVGGAWEHTIYGTGPGSSFGEVEVVR